MDDQPKVRPVKVRPVKVLKAVVTDPPEDPVRKAVVRPVVVPKPVQVTKPVAAPKPAPVAPMASSVFQLDPWKMDPARVFHFGHALIWFLEMGVKQVGIRPDWSVEVHSHDGRVMVIPPIVMMTRDRRYALDYIRTVMNGKETNGLTWHLDQYDKELARLLKQWATGD